MTNVPNIPQKPPTPPSGAAAAGSKLPSSTPKPSPGSTPKTSSTPGTDAGPTRSIPTAKPPTPGAKPPTPGAKPPQPTEPRPTPQQAPAKGPGTSDPLGPEPRSSKDILRDQQRTAAEPSSAGDDSAQKSSDSSSPSREEKPTSNQSSTGQPSDTRTPREARKELAKTAASEGLDQVAGSGASDDLQKMARKEDEEGNKVSTDERTIYAAKNVARAANVKFAGGNAAINEGIDRVGDTMVSVTRFQERKKREMKDAARGKALMDAAVGEDSRRLQKRKQASMRDPNPQNRKKGGAGTPGTPPPAGGDAAASGGFFAGKSKWLIPVAVVVAAALLISVVLFGGRSAFDGQPDEESDDTVMEYIPGGEGDDGGGSWYEVATQAVEHQLKQVPPTQVPWPLIMGIAAEQTDMGRYSPYDAIDRDPDREATPIVSSSPSVGGGPGEIQLINTGDMDRTNIIWREQTVVEALIEGGFTEEMAAGIVGNMHYESGIEPARAEVGYPFPSDRGWGLVQWTFTRNTQLVNKVKSELGPKYYTNDPRSLTDDEWLELLELQINHIFWEAEGGYKAIFDDMRAASSVTEASTIFLERYEIPADIAGQRPIRAAMAESVLRRYQEGGVSAIPTSPDGPTAVSHTWDDQITGGPLPYLRNVQTQADNVGMGSCPVDLPDPDIGGEDGEGVGPFLLTEGSAARATSAGYNPQSPCVADWIATELAEVALRVSDEPGNVYNLEAPWPYGEDEDGPASGPSRDRESRDYDAMTPEERAEARAVDLFEDNVLFWQVVVQESDLFADRNELTDDCELTGGAQDESDAAIAQQIVFSFHCELAKESTLEQVLRAYFSQPDSGDEDAPAQAEPSFQTTASRYDAEMNALQEALQVSYTATEWDMSECDPTAERAGPFMLTPGEMRDGGYAPEDRCDTAKSAAAAARLFADGESTALDKRSDDDGPFQPALGGWDNISYAMGDDRYLFVEHGSTSPTLNVGEACYEDMVDWVEHVAKESGSGLDEDGNPTGFADLIGFDEDDDASRRAAVEAGFEWADSLATGGILGIGGKTPPHLNGSCPGGAATSYAEMLGEIAIELDVEEEDSDRSRTLRGFANWASWSRAEQGGEPIPGESTLVNRLSFYTYTHPEIPLPSDNLTKVILDAIGSRTGYVPLPQRAVEYAIFFGGLSQPFDTAEKVYGSLQEVQFAAGPSGPSGSQTEVDAEGCPVAPGPKPNAMRYGAEKEDLNDLCRRSVAEARTPEAAMAVKWALQQVGHKMYSQSKRMDADYADCSSLVSRAYQEGAGLKLYEGWAPVTGQISSFGAERGWPQIPMSELQGGDWFMNRPGHIVLVLADGYVVHASTWGLPVLVSPIFTDSFNVGGYIDVDHFPKLDHHYTKQGPPPGGGDDSDDSDD